MVKRIKTSYANSVFCYPNPIKELPRCRKPGFHLQIHTFLKTHIKKKHESVVKLLKKYLKTHEHKTLLKLTNRRTIIKHYRY